MAGYGYHTQRKGKEDKLKKAEDKLRKKGGKGLTLDEVAMLAGKAGMTYGQYVSKNGL